MPPKNPCHLTRDRAQVVERQAPPRVLFQLVGHGVRDRGNVVEVQVARVFGEVVSIERIRGLHEQARTNLRSLRMANLRLVFGDGQLGVSQAAPYDLVIAAAAGEAIPPAWLEQLTVGGRLIAPVSGPKGQALHLVERTGPDRWQLTVLDAVRFVPLREGTA